MPLKLDFSTIKNNYRSNLKIIGCHDAKHVYMALVIYFILKKKDRMAIPGFQILQYLGHLGYHSRVLTS